MNAKRSLVLVAVCGLGPLVISSLVAGEVPHWSWQRWVVLLAGFVVIAVGFEAAQWLVEHRRGAHAGD